MTNQVGFGLNTINAIMFNCIKIELICCKNNTKQKTRENIANKNDSAVVMVSGAAVCILKPGSQLQLFDFQVPFPFHVMFPCLCDLRHK